MILILDNKTYTGRVLKWRKPLVIFRLNTFLLQISSLSTLRSKFTLGEFFGLSVSEIKVPLFLLVSCYVHTIPLPQSSETVLFRKIEFPEEISQSLFLPIFWKHAQYFHLRVLEWFLPFYFQQRAEPSKVPWGLCQFRLEKDSFPFSSDTSSLAGQILLIIQKQLRESLS